MVILLPKHFICIRYWTGCFPDYGFIKTQKLQALDWINCTLVKYIKARILSVLIYLSNLSFSTGVLQFVVEDIVVVHLFESGDKILKIENNSSIIGLYLIA